MRARAERKRLLTLCQRAVVIPNALGETCLSLALSARRSSGISAGSRPIIRATVLTAETMSWRRRSARDADRTASTRSARVAREGVVSDMRCLVMTGGDWRTDSVEGHYII